MSEKKLWEDYFDDLNFIVLIRLELGELITGSLRAFYSRISPSLVRTLSLPANFYRNEDLKVWRFYLVLSRIINVSINIFFFHFIKLQSKSLNRLTSSYILFCCLIVLYLWGHFYDLKDFDLFNGMILFWGIVKWTIGFWEFIFLTIIK